MTATPNHDTMNTNSGGRMLAVGLLCGAAVGATLGLLFAPKSGSATRKDLARSARDVRQRAVNVYHSAKTGLNDRAIPMVEKGKDAIERLAERARG
jgi:gas vesicle protein